MVRSLVISFLLLFVHMCSYSFSLDLTVHDALLLISDWLVRCSLSSDYLPIDALDFYGDSSRLDFSWSFAVWTRDLGLAALDFYTTKLQSLFYFNVSVRFECDLNSLSYYRKLWSYAITLLHIYEVFNQKTVSKNRWQMSLNYIYVRRHIIK